MLSSRYDIRRLPGHHQKKIAPSKVLKLAATPAAVTGQDYRPHRSSRQTLAPRPTRAEPDHTKARAVLARRRRGWLPYSAKKNLRAVPAAAVCGHTGKSRRRGNHHPRARAQGLSGRAQSSPSDCSFPKDSLRRRWGGSI